MAVVGGLTMRRTVILAGIAIVTTPSITSAQSIRLPGIGKIRVPRVLKPLISEPTNVRPRDASSREPIASVVSRQRADGSWTCGASIDMPRFGRVRIVRASATDRPSLMGIQGAVASGIQRWWEIEYEVTSHLDNTQSVAHNWISTSAIDDRGEKWRSIDMSRQSGVADGVQGSSGILRAMLISHTPGSSPIRMAPALSVNLFIRSSRRNSIGINNTQLIRFADIPGNCYDDDAPGGTNTITVASTGEVGELRRPQQRTGPGVQVISAKPGSVQEAVQIGFTWAYGEGVDPDLQQGLAWYREAERRQMTSRDYSFRTTIARDLGAFALRDKVVLMERGLKKGAANGWQEARFYYGLGSQLGDPQAMAALGYVWGEGYKRADKVVYFCRAAFLAARASKVEHELDAVNYFCPTQTFAALMTPAERAANPRSIARARAKSGEVQRQYDDSIAFAKAMKAMANEMMSIDNKGAGRSCVDGKDAVSSDCR